MTLLPLAHVHYPTAAGGGSTVFEETWSSATPGTYTSGGVTGSDETWTQDDCSGSGTSGVIVPNPADDYVTLSGNGDDWYFKCSDIGADSTNNEIWIDLEIPATNGGELNIYLYTSNATQQVFQIDVVDEDEIYVKYQAPNEDFVDSGAGADTRFTMKFTIDQTAKTFDYDINGQTGSNLDWRDNSGSGSDDPVRLEMYISNNANNLKKLGEVKVGDNLV